MVFDIIDSITGVGYHVDYDVIQTTPLFGSPSVFVLVVCDWRFVAVVFQLEIDDTSTSPNSTVTERTHDIITHSSGPGLRFILSSVSERSRVSDRSVTTY